MAATIKIIITTDGGVDKVKADVSGLGDTAQKAGGGFSSLKEVATGALRQIGTMAIEAGAQAVQAIGSFVSDSISAAGNFEAAVNGLAAVTGDSLTKAGFDFDDVKDKALQLGADTQFSAQQAIEAMTELAKGGVPVKDVMGDATDATLALASAAKLDLANAAEIVSKQLGVWGETGVTASEVADLLASAANASTVDVDELALGLANVGGTAKTAGVSFEDLTQTMALIAPNFSSAADAGTSLKTFISRLIPTTDKATEMMAALGLATEDGKSKFFDASGAFIGMEQASQLLQDGLAGLSEEEKLTALNTIFGSDAIRAAAAIANAGADGFDAMGQAMTDAGGAAAASAIQNQGFGFALEQMKGSIETVQIVIGSMLLPVLTSLLNDVITPGINTIMTFAQAIGGSDEAFNKLTPDMQAVITVVDSVAQGFNEGGLLGALNQLIPGLTGTGTAFTSLTSTAQTVLDALLATANQVFGTLEVYVPAVMAAIQMYVQSYLDQIMAFWSAHGTEVMAFVQTTWTTISEIINTALALILSIVTGVLAVIAGFIDAHGSEIQLILSGAWQTISNIISGVLAVIKGLLQAALAVMQGDWQGAWEAIQSASETFVLSIKGAIEGFLNTIAGFFNTSLDGIKQTWTNIFSQLPGIVSNLVGEFVAVGKAIIGGITQGIVDAAGQLAQAAIDAVKDALSAAADAIGMGSPAKAFMPIGLSMAQGMAVGATAGAPLVAQASSVAAGAGIDGAASASATYNQQRSMTYAPTINNYGAASDGLDYATAVSLAGV